jgi:alpha-amylase
VLTRRPEAYHAQVAMRAATTGGGARTIHETPAHKETGLAARLAADPFRRASLLDGLFPPGEPLDPVAPWSAATAALGHARFSHGLERVPGGVTVTFVPDDDLPVGVVKRVSVRDATVRADYRLRPAGPGRWAVQWNLALTAGDAPGRYLTVPGRPSLASAGCLDGMATVALVDEWIGVRVTLAWTPGADLGWGPVETVSVSEGGFERIYQGLALLLTWPLGAAPLDVWTALTVSAA